MQAHAVGGHDGRPFRAVDVRVDVNPLRQAERPIDHLLQAAAEIAAARLGEHGGEHVRPLALEIVVPVDVADLVVGVQVVVVRQHARRLPGRAVERALVAGVADGLDESAVEVVLNVVQEGGGVEQSPPCPALLARQVVLAEEPRVQLRHDVARPPASRSAAAPLPRPPCSFSCEP